MGWLRRKVITTDLSDNVKWEIVQGKVTVDMLSSATEVYTFSNGIIHATSKITGVTNTHPFIMFPSTFAELTFKHIRDDDWIGLGGDGTHTTGMGIGNPWSIRLIDLGPTNGVAVDSVVVSDKAVVGDYINLSWSGTTLVAKKNKNDGKGFQTWFSVDLSLYPQLQYYKLGTCFSAVANSQGIDLMSVTNSIDRINVLEQGGLTVWKNKNWNAVGDSITQTGKYIPLVANALGLISHNYGLASSTLAINNTYLQNQSVLERVAGLNGNVAVPDADVWSIMAAVNDWLYTTPVGTMANTTADTTTFYGALKALIENILGRTNTPRLIMFTPLQSNRNGNNSVGVSMQAYRQAIKDVCDYYSVPVLDLYGIGGINPLNLNTFTSDGVHPTDAGTNYYYTKIVAAIKSL